ncbi:cytoplasmic protein [Streptococcus uberis]|uniref:cytoplasmic protein n=2 Tax=Streptococcus uberis TaxID=1349 RepID=UPI001EF0A6A0|nr:cytoplasmic protein [Streptococcus uberis]
MMDEYNYELAHYYCSNHKLELENDKVCGCFYCTEIYSPTEIDEWLIEDTMIDHRGTAICPKCGIDAVIGESSGFPITKEFLVNMQRRRFF